MMNVEQYLKILNGVPDEEQLTSENLQMGGFIDVFPDRTTEDVLAKSYVEFKISSGVLTASRTYDIIGGENILDKKVSLLSDDISLHCSDPIGTIEKTIISLEKLQESVNPAMYEDKSRQPDYSARADRFKAALSNMKTNTVSVDVAKK